VKFIGAGEIIEVPPQVAKCPECGGKLLTQVCAWETETRKPSEEGVEVDCENEADPDDPDYEDCAHRHWQGEWMPAVDRVTKWLQANYRIIEGENATAKGASDEA